MYTTTTTITASVAMNAKPTSGPHFQPSRIDSTNANTLMPMIATSGVLNLGWMCPSARGARPLRANA